MDNDKTFSSLSASRVQRRWVFCGQKNHFRQALFSHHASDPWSANKESTRPPQVRQLRGCSADGYFVGRRIIFVKLHFRIMPTKQNKKTSNPSTANKELLLAS